MKTIRRAVVVSGGPITGPAPIEPASDDLVIAADSGLDVALRWGWAVDMVVGDLDSVSADALQGLDERTTVERHPVDKDELDLELALEAAVRSGAAEAVVVATARGRLDHAVALFSVLASPRWRSLCIAAWVDGSRVLVVRGGDRAEIVGEHASLVSLLPFHGDAQGVVTTGLRFPLRGEALLAGAARGVSNELAGELGSVEVGDGVVLVIQPDASA